MSTYLQIYSAADDKNFQARCRVATWIAAQAIAAEGDDTPNHAMRADWAARVLQEKIGISDRQLAVQVLRNPVIAQDPTNTGDDAIQYQVNSVLDAIMAIG